MRSRERTRKESLATFHTPSPRPKSKRTSATRQSGVAFDETGERATPSKPDGQQREEPLRAAAGRRAQAQRRQPVGARGPSAVLAQHAQARGAGRLGRVRLHGVPRQRPLQPAAGRGEPVRLLSRECGRPSRDRVGARGAYVLVECVQIWRVRRERAARANCACAVKYV